MEHKNFYEEAVNQFEFLEMEMFKYGLQPTHSTDYSDLRRISWTYSLPEYYDLSDDRAFLNKMDMRDSNKVLIYLEMSIFILYRDYASINLDKIIATSGSRLTRKEYNAAVNEEAGIRMRRSKRDCTIRKGEVWTNGDYDRVKKEVDDNVIEVDVSNMSDDEIKDMMKSLDGKTDRFVRFFMGTLF